MNMPTEYACTIQANLEEDKNAKHEKNDDDYEKVTEPVFGERFIEIMLWQNKNVYSKNFQNINKTKKTSQGM